MLPDPTAGPSEIPIQELLEALVDVDTPLSANFLYRLSDLEPGDLEQLKTLWPQVPLWRRQALMEKLEKIQKQAKEMEN